MKRSKAQLRATRKMIAANKRRTKAKRSGKRRGKRNPLNPIARAGTKRGARKAARTRAAKKAKRSRAAKKGHRARKAGKARKSGKRKSSARVGKSTKRSRAAKKGARTRKRNAAMRSAAAKKGARKAKRKGGKRKSPRKSKARKHSKRSAASYRKAGRKAARTRARRRNASDPTKSSYSGTGSDYSESRRRRRRGKRKNPIAKARRRHKRRNPIARSGKLFGVRNPIPLEGGLDFFSGVFAVALGYIFAAGADRFGSTHALTSSNAQGGYVDAPAVGQIYNSEATSLPIWSSGMRIAFNALAIAAPLGLSAFIKDKGPKSFFQLMAFAAIARTVGKAAEDGLSMALASTSFGLRLYAPEMAAQSKITGATTAALPAAAPGVFAGVPRTNALAAAPHSIQAPSGFEAPAQQHKPLGTLPTSATGFVAPQQHVAGAPINSAPQSHGVSFNPWADTDRNRND